MVGYSPKMIHITLPINLIGSDVYDVSAAQRKYRYVHKPFGTLQLFPMIFKPLLRLENVI